MAVSSFRFKLSIQPQAPEVRGCSLRGPRDLGGPCAPDPRAADGRGRAHWSEVLWLQAGHGSASADIRQVYRLTRQQRQGHAAAEHLVTAIARETVDFDDACALAPSAQKPDSWVLHGRVYSQQSSLLKSVMAVAWQVIEADIGFGCHKQTRFPRETWFV